MSRSPDADKPNLIVLIEDDVALRAALYFALVTAGYRVAQHALAATVAEAQLRECACLVTDHHLPGPSGLETIEAFRARGCATPMILMTTQPSATVRRRARAAGAQIVEKPILGDRLLRTIREAVSR